MLLLLSLSFICIRISLDIPISLAGMIMVARHFSVKQDDDADGNGGGEETICHGRPGRLDNMIAVLGRRYGYEVLVCVIWTISYLS
jgi:hypothetical protein